MTSITRPSAYWSGYSLYQKESDPFNDPFRETVGYWTVPQVTAEGFTAIESSWVGLGGMDASIPLWQTGTHSGATWLPVIGNGTYYEAFFTLLGTNKSTGGDIVFNKNDFPIRPGDSMYADVWFEVKEFGTADLHLYLHNMTTGLAVPWTITNVAGWAGLGSSAEWIDERPAGPQSDPLPNLAKYGSTSWSGLETGIDFNHLSYVSGNDIRLNRSINYGMDKVGDTYVYSDRILQLTSTFNDYTYGYSNYWNMYC